MAVGGARSITDVSVELPQLSEVISVLTFQSGFNSSLVLLGTTLLGFAAGLIGCFSLLRKRALMGDALAHSALPGLAGAFLLATTLGFDGKSLPLLLTGATISGVLGVLTVQFLKTCTRLHEEAAIGAVLSSFFGAGVVILSAIQYLDTGSAGGLSHFIYGQTAAMQQFDAFLLAGIASLALVATLLLFKELTLLCFDPEYAAVGGWPVTTIDIFLMALVSIVTVVGLQSVGMILIVALLIIPPAAARFWTERLPTMLGLSALFGGLSGYAGAAASSLLPRLPAGSIIVLAAGTVFMVSFLFAPARGVIASFVRLLVLRIRIAREHLLRDCFETAERLGVPLPSPLPVQELWSLRRYHGFRRALLRWYLRSAGFAVSSAGTITLTALGETESRRITRNHRLWEEYLRHHTDLLPSQLDYSADYAEHSLSPEIIERLEQRLIEEGRISKPEEIPASVHGIRAQRGSS